MMMLLSCSPQKRVERILKNNPYLLAEEIITVRDTVLVPGIIADTMVITNKADTVEIYKDRLYTRVIRIMDTLYIHSECFPDTIIIERELTVQKIKELPTGKEKQTAGWLFSIFLFCALLLFLAGRAQEKR